MNKSKRWCLVVAALLTTAVVGVAQVTTATVAGTVTDPRSVLRGLSQWNVDFSLGKTVLCGESMRMQSRGDFLNGLNHINPGNPVTALM